MFRYYCTLDKYHFNLTSQGAGPAVANLISHIGVERLSWFSIVTERKQLAPVVTASFDVLSGVWTTSPGGNNSQKQRTQQTWPSEEPPWPGLWVRFRKAPGSKASSGSHSYWQLVAIGGECSSLLWRKATWGKKGLILLTFPVHTSIIVGS